MKKKKIKEMLRGIQGELEKLQGEDVDVIYMSNTECCGVVNGSITGLAALMAWNMIRYPMFKVIVEMAVSSYPELASKVGDEVRGMVLGHEIIDMGGNECCN